MLTPHSQVRNRWFGRPSATQEHLVLAFRAYHPLVLFPLPPLVQRAHPRQGLARVHVVAQDLPLPLPLSAVRFRLLISKVL
jgi:hypothetical protein